MKIIIVGTAYPYRGGLAAFNERLATELQNEGDTISIETFTVQYPKLLFPGKTQYTDGEAPNLSITRSVNSVNPMNWGKVGTSIAEKNPDVVIFAYWMSFMVPCYATIAKKVKKLCNAKCIGLIHNMMPHEPSILDVILPPYFVDKMDAFFALSDSVIHDIERIEKDKKPKAVSPHPIYDHYGKIITRDEALQALGLPADKQYILFFGFIRDYKGLDLLLEAMSDERIKQSNIHLLVAGEFYGNEEKYKTLTKNLNIENITWYSHYIPDIAVNQYFCAADVIVQPYKSATQSGVTQIGYHFEKPMIVTNVGGLPEIVPNGKIGYVVEPNGHALADAIVAFYKEQKQEEFTANLQEEKKKYKWNILTSRLKKLITES